MDELLRYLWLHGTERAASEMLVYVILFVVAVGSVIRSKLLVVRNMDGLMAAAVVAVPGFPALAEGGHVAGGGRLCHYGRFGAGPVWRLHRFSAGRAGWFLFHNLHSEM